MRKKAVTDYINEDPKRIELLDIIKRFCEVEFRRLQETISIQCVHKQKKHIHITINCIFILIKVRRTKTKSYFWGSD